MAVIILTTGVPGSGKTYIRCARFLVDDFLVNTGGVHISNFPVNVDSISEAVSKKINRSRGIFGIFRKKVTPADIAARIEVIPDDVLQSWRLCLSGPWEYFRGRNLKYAHIALDEVHNFINSNMPPDFLSQWEQFLAEVRHRGCTFEGITQDIDQVDRILTGRASVRLELVPGEDLRDPFFKIKMSDWYELKAGFTGFYHKTVFLLEKRKQDSRWKTNHTTRFILTPDYYQYYNSYNASLQEKASGEVDENRVPEHEYEKRGKISLLLWFIRRNFLSIFFRFCLTVLVIWLLFLGGLTWLINSVVGSLLWSASPTAAASSKTSSVPKSVTTTSVTETLSTTKEKSLEQQKYDEQKKERFENGFKPGLFFEGACYLRNGIRVYEGYKFANEAKHKEYFGKSVIKLDSKDRFIKLSDGTVVDMY